MNFTIFGVVTGKGVTIRSPRQKGCGETFSLHEQPFFYSCVKNLSKIVSTAFFITTLYQPLTYASETLYARLYAYKPYVLKASRIYGVRPEFIEAVILAESAGKAHVKSHKGAIGLMQIHPVHAKNLKFPTYYLENPRINVFVGTWYLRKLLNKYNGSMILALAAYNAGPGNVRKYKGVPPFEETQKYIMKVLRFYAQLLSRKKN